MTLVRTSALNGIAVAIRMGTALVLNKILAVYVGPAGYAIIGQFQNAMTMAIAFATGAVATGVTKITSEHYDDEARQRALWRTAGTVVIGASLVAAVLIVLFRGPLSSALLGGEALAGVFVWLAVSLVFISLNALLLAILNGRKEVRRYVTSNIAGSLLSLAVVGMLAWRYGLYGALVALSVYQGVVFFVTLQQALSAPWFSLRDLFGRIDRKHLRHLFHFMLMAAATSIAVPLSHVLVRRHLGETFGWEHAGYWDAMWRISTIYLTLVTTTLSLYYLPRIAEIRAWPELRTELIHVYRIVLPMVIAASLAVYILRDFIITLLFTADFAPMRVLFPWQMAGDVVKIGSWLVAYLMIGRGLVGAFIATEIGSAVSFWLLTIILTPLLGFEAVAAAHLVNYLLYALAVWLITIATPARRAALFR